MVRVNGHRRLLHRSGQPTWEDMHGHTERSYAFFVLACSCRRLPLQRYRSEAEAQAAWQAHLQQVRQS
jgi:hypothetical protein